MSYAYDVLIIGSGAAGLGLALSLPNTTRIALLSKDSLSAGSSPWAQGGIAAVMNQNDAELNAHIQDTLRAGAGLCDPAVVEFTVKNAKKAMEWLIAQGMQFTMTPSQDLHLTQEGGHSQRRILHAADKTGAAVIETLHQQVLKRPNITCLTEHTAIDFLVEKNQCFGATVFDNTKNRCDTITAAITVLATGGASQVYAHTSCPDTTSGDGIAIAWRAGCRIANLEFNQFHPTCFYHPDSPPFLITEVIRGEGGILRLPNGERFMTHYDERAELAPRDIVARAIDAELKKNKLDCVYLDISHRNAEFIQSFFPNIYQHCLDYGIDMTQQAIPVVPAAHYTCGGVMTDLHGRTNIDGLYAIGEVASTGLHGANRMASNSLLECLVFAASASRDIQTILPTLQKTKPVPVPTHQQPANTKINITALKDRLRQIMWNKVGIVRSNTRLKEAHAAIELIKREIDTHFEKAHFNKEALACRNLAHVATLMIRSALERKESRGLHFNVDYPDTLNSANNTVLCLKE